jgi:nucleotide-binding universal stress UspA family protein
MGDWGPKSILVGYDGSEGARMAADLAANVASKFGASVVVMTSFKHQSRTIEPGMKATREIEEANEIADQMVKYLTDQGIAAEKDVIEGPASDALLNVAKVRDVQLIVVGSRGLNPVRELLLGSTSEKVVRHAHVPVLIAR